jgi:negative regulator of flagellin synthesis FlgM
MKISNINQDKQAIQQIQQGPKISPVNKKKSAQDGQKIFTGPDKVDLSAESKEMKKIYNVLAGTPETRTERVAELKKLVETGQYQIKSEDVADKMVKDFILELNK